MFDCIQALLHFSMIWSESWIRDRRKEIIVAQQHRAFRRVQQAVSHLGAAQTKLSAQTTAKPTKSIQSAVCFHTPSEADLEYVIGVVCCAVCYVFVVFVVVHSLCFIVCLLFRSCHTMQKPTRLVHKHTHKANNDTQANVQSKSQTNRHTTSIIWCMNSDEHSRFTPLWSALLCCVVVFVLVLCLCLHWVCVFLFVFVAVVLCERVL